MAQLSAENVPEQGPTRVLILSDVHLLGWGIEVALTGLPGIETTVKQPSERALAEIVAQEPPDLIIVACERCYPHLLQRLLSRLQANGPRGLICLSSRQRDCPYGLTGLVLPLAEVKPTALRQALQKVLAEVSDSPPGSGQGDDWPQAGGEGQAGPEQERVSVREREVGMLVTEGYSSQEIAEKLFISQRTVEKHRANLMAKLGVSNAAALTRELMYLCWAEQGKFTSATNSLHRPVTRAERRQVS